MSNLLENWQKSLQLSAVRLERHRRIIQGLIVVGSLFLAIFGGLALTEHNYALGGILLGSMCLGFGSVYLSSRQKDLKKALVLLNVVLGILALTLIYTGGKNNSGMLWVYPIFAISLLINRFRVALFLAGGFIVLCGLMLLTPLVEYLQADYSQVVALRFVITLIALYTICLVAIYSEEHAYDLVIKLHDNDIHRLAFYDTLTGLPNRWNFNESLSNLIQNRQASESVALLFIDLDNFKAVNDNYGHETGDKLLMLFGQELQRCLQNYQGRVTTRLARLAGDEFVVILSGEMDRRFISVIAAEIIQMFEGGFSIEQSTYPVYASMGIALCPDDSDNPTDLLRYADAGMYQAKNMGNNNYQFFTQDIAQQLQQKQHIELNIKAAIDSKQFSLSYQAIYCSQTNAIVSIETIVKSLNSDLADYGPEVFIPIAEATGLIQRLDRLIIEQAVQDFIEIQQTTGFEGTLAINISGVELLEENFPSDIKTILDRHHLPCEKVELEVTETALVPDNPTVITVLNQLDQLGFAISLDDFGTGYTSFNQLILYPASSLKIDRSFVSALFSSDEAHQQMVETIRNLAKIFQLRVIAEGVETQQQYDYLKNIGCEWLQGYLLARPLDKQGLIEKIELNMKAK